MLLADDVHWADRASLRWLVFLAERLEDVKALLVVATRPAEPGADQELLDALMAAQAARVVRPAPLSEAATTAVVRGRLPQAVDAFGAACHRATGGNPFLLGELLGELAADGVEGAASDVGKVLEFGSERVGRAVRRRLRGLAARGDLGRARGGGSRPGRAARRGGVARRSRRGDGRRGGRRAGEHPRPGGRPRAGLRASGCARRRLRADSAARTPGAARRGRQAAHGPGGRERARRTAPAAPAAELATPRA